MKIDPEKLDLKAAHQLLVSAVVPRPIALVSTVGANGIYNAAPYSSYALMSSTPAVVGFGVSPNREGKKKDTLINIEFAGDFVINAVPESMAEAMNQTAGEYPIDVDEFREAGLTPEKGDLVKSPMVAESPVKMECRVMQILSFDAASRTSYFIIGEVLRVHIKDELWIDGVIKNHRLKAIGRLGEDFYCRTSDIFSMGRPVVKTKQ